jgi:hypothetical protein
VALVAYPSVAAHGDRMNEIERAAHLACGLLWMVEHRSDKVKAAYVALRDAIGRDALGEAIKAAIDAGHEADHPADATWWAGMKEARK